MIANMEGGVPTRAATLQASPPRRDVLPLQASFESTLDRTRHWLLEEQHDDGHWVGELEGDTILESEYVLLMAYLGREGEEVCARACKYLFEKQRPEGGWSIYPGGPFDLSASVKAYFALKLVGMSPEHPAMCRAREAILEAGGAQACNSFTRFYLALLGQIGLQRVSERAAGAGAIAGGAGV